MQKNLLQGKRSLKHTDPAMVVVEVLPDCWTDPIRLACVPRSFFAYSIGIVVSDDDSTINAPRYFLHVALKHTRIV